MPVVITAMKNQPSNRASLDCTARTHRSTSWYMPPALPAGATRASENATSLYGGDDQSHNDDHGLWAVSDKLCRQTHTNRDPDSPRLSAYRMSSHERVLGAPRGSYS